MRTILVFYFLFLGKSWDGGHRGLFTRRPIFVLNRKINTHFIVCQAAEEDFYYGQYEEFCRNRISKRFSK